MEGEMIDTNELRKAAQAVYLATEEAVADDLSYKLTKAAQEIDDLRDFAIWMTGCGYDFARLEYFRKQRDRLLKEAPNGD